MTAENPTAVQRFELAEKQLPSASPEQRKGLLQTAIDALNDDDWTLPREFKSAGVERIAQYVETGSKQEKELATIWRDAVQKDASVELKRTEIFPTAHKAAIKSIEEGFLTFAKDQKNPEFLRQEAGKLYLELHSPVMSRLHKIVGLFEAQAAKLLTPPTDPASPGGPAPQAPKSVKIGSPKAA